MPDLSGIGGNALEMQQRHEDFEAGIDRSRRLDFRAMLRQACGGASSGGWF